MDSLDYIEVQIVSAFVDNDRGGNPAGVVFNADHLSNEQKLSVAKQVGLSETAFVSKSATADFKLDFFTPTRQIAHCGHATIATFSYLAQEGVIHSTHSSKETIDGNREIVLRGDMAFMEQKAPQYTNLDHEKNRILKSLGLSEKDLLSNKPIYVVNTGNSFVIIPVDSQTALRKIQPDLNLITEISDEYDLIGYYAFCLQPNIQGRDANTRMFAPRYGIKEEAATGMAAGPLACYLLDILDLKKSQFFIEQGWFMAPPSPSLIIVDLSMENNRIKNVLAGGKGIPVKTIKVLI